MNNYILGCFFFFYQFAAIVFAQNKTESVVWRLDSLDKICGNSIAVFGNPEIIFDGESTAVKFDGIDDGIIVHADPLAGATTFTVEIIFKPDTSSNPANKEQRFLHIQNPDYEPRRMLIELRLANDGKWFLDTHINADTMAHTLYAEKFTHQLNKWYHAALVYENGMMIHYVNGIEEMRGKVKYLPVTGGNVSIGMRMNKRSYFKGEIKLIRVTKGALTPEQFFK
ncbi:MAG: LamG domain-containing protein [Melioribacter sp.]|nr:LamG domain-containing protein [Melioribacter sp.]